MTYIKVFYSILAFKQSLCFRKSTILSTEISNRQISFAALKATSNSAISASLVSLSIVLFNLLSGQEATCHLKELSLIINMGMKSTVRKLVKNIIRVSSDIWSLGLSLMELGYGTHPFPRLKPDEIEELMRLPEGTPVRNSSLEYIKFFLGASASSSCRFHRHSHRQGGKRSAKIEFRVFRS
jgi:serine/threonine protein kinase